METHRRTKSQTSLVILATHRLSPAGGNDDEVALERKRKRTTACLRTVTRSVCTDGISAAGSCCDNNAAAVHLWSLQCCCCCCCSDSHIVVDVIAAASAAIATVYHCRRATLTRCACCCDMAPGRLTLCLALLVHPGELVYLMHIQKHLNVSLK